MSETDLSVEQAKQLASQRLRELMDNGIEAAVYFKFTCEHCGERVLFNEANAIYERGECCTCHKETEIKKVGMMLLMGGDVQNITPRLGLE